MADIEHVKRAVREYFRLEALCFDDATQRPRLKLAEERMCDLIQPSVSIDGCYMIVEDVKMDDPPRRFRYVIFKGLVPDDLLFRSHTLFTLSEWRRGVGLVEAVAEVRKAAA